MSAKRGFTLAEMLAVIGIMLVLMVTAFGVFSTFAQRVGPDTAVSTIQAMLNGARDYAAANGVWAAVRFNADFTRPDNGTTMRLCYAELGTTGAWKDVRGRSPVSLGENMFACKDLPATLTAAATVGDARSDSDIRSWKSNEEQMTGPSGYITMHAMDATKNNNFYVVFDPSGCMKTSADSLPDSPSVVQDGLTVVQLLKMSDIGQGRVTAYALYPMNSMSGTRLLFDF